jgi:type II secretory pathway pseudopilin PulG
MIALYSKHRLTILEATAKPRLRDRAPRGFSLTELLVVIGIIILLIGLLLVALGQVRKKALRSRTESVMTQFANACTAFQAEHGMYPGVIPDEVILATIDTNGLALLSFTENALLHLMGGYRVMSPNDYATPPNAVEIEYDAYLAAAAGAAVELTFDQGGPNPWKIVIDKRKIGEGPVINGKSYGPYFTPGQSDIAPASYAISGAEPTNPTPTNEIPDLIDGWGQPIIYIRAARNRGPLVDRNPAANPRPQFTPWSTSPNRGGVWRYLRSIALGELSENQNELSIFGGASGISAALSDPQVDEAFAVLLSHPAFFKSAITTPAGSPRLGSPRGQFMLWSAGADGVFMSRVDGTGSRSAPLSGANIAEKFINPGPRVLDEFDDVRVYGGG